MAKMAMDRSFGAAGLMAVSAAGLGFILRSRYERGHFVVETCRVASPKIRREKKLVFITDVHDQEFGPGGAELLKAVREQRPDGILIGGDLMVAKKGRGGLDATFRLLEGLAGIGPVFYSLGNHESRLDREREVYGDRYDQLIKKAEELGVCLLIDRTVPFDEVDITGVELSRSYYKKLFLERPVKMPKGYLARKLGTPDPDRFQLLLIHSPMYFERCRQWGADLTLAGHFHGGTIRIPGLGGVMTPQYQFFVPWCAGCFEKDGKRMLVGRGLGTHSIDIRFNDLPQVLVVRLVPGAFA